MRTGILGGVFNPPHFGHIIPIIHILEKGIVDRVIVIPCKKQPLKEISLDFNTRYELVKMAFETYNNIEISDIENTLDEPSYTINTVKLLKQRTNESLFLIIGYDEANQINKWYKYEELKKYINFIIIKRKCNENLIMKNYFSKAIFVNNPVFEISSSKIRDNIKNKKPVNGLLPEKIIKEIYRRKLYIE